MEKRRQSNAEHQVATDTIFKVFGMTQLVLNAQTPTSKANAETIMPDESLVFRQEHHNRKYNPQVKLCCTVVYIYFCIFALRQIMGDAALVHTHNLFFEQN